MAHQKISLGYQQDSWTEGRSASPRKMRVDPGIDVKSERLAICVPIRSPDR